MNKWTIQKTLTVIVIAALTGSINAANVSVENLTGVVAGNKIPVGAEVVFLLRLTNDFPDTMLEIANSFRVYSPDGAIWFPHAFVDTSFGFPIGTTFDTTFYGHWTDSSVGINEDWSDYFDFRDCYAIWEPDLGTDSDTVGFTAEEPTGPGLMPSVSILPWQLRIDSISTQSVGASICLDSASTPSLPWGWANGASVHVPSWDGPYCFEIVADCCEGFRGNINLDLQDTIDISDLTALVGWMFKSGAAPPCMLEADVDGNSSHDIADVTYLVGYMFKSGPEPAGCP